MSQRVYLHVGVPKSGTTFLQASLAANKPGLREAGILYPNGHERMFLAAVDVRGAHKAWGRTRAEVDGTWDTLCRKARKHDGTTVISHELLGAASAHQVTAAMTMLRGLDVHLVVTARDPARQAVAEWQEGIKHGRRLTFEQFRRRVLDHASETDYARRYRASQDLPAVLARWGADLPPSRVHVVTCPPPDADPLVLWERFASVVGFDPVDHPPATDAANRSLGTVEIDLLRRVNVALDKRLVQPAYGKVVKQLYAQQVLPAHRSARPALPAEMYDDLAVVGERWTKEIDKAGYVVHGDLAELVPSPADAPTGPHPDEVDPRDALETAASATAELLVELDRRDGDVHRLEAENATLRKKRKRLKRRLRTAEDGVDSDD